MSRFTEEEIAVITARAKGPRLAKNHLSPAAATPKQSKYRNVKTEAGGIVFDSAKEAARWQELQILERAGEIKDLVRQHRFDLRVNGELICFYKADFVYREKLRDWSVVVEDVKGVKTQAYTLKKKLMHAIYKIFIRET